MLTKEMMEEWDDIKSNKQGKGNKVKKQVCKQDVGRGRRDESEVWKQEVTRIYRRKRKIKHTQRGGGKERGRTRICSGRRWGRLKKEK